MPVWTHLAPSDCAKDRKSVKFGRRRWQTRYIKPQKKATREKFSFWLHNFHRFRLYTSLTCYAMYPKRALHISNFWKRFLARFVDTLLVDIFHHCAPLSVGLSLSPTRQSALFTSFHVKFAVILCFSHLLPPSSSSRNYFASILGSFTFRRVRDATWLCHPSAEIPSQIKLCMNNDVNSSNGTLIVRWATLSLEGESELRAHRNWVAIQLNQLWRTRTREVANTRGGSPTTLL